MPLDIDHLEELQPGNTYCDNSGAWKPSLVRHIQKLEHIFALITVVITAAGCVEPQLTEEMISDKSPIGICMSGPYFVVHFANTIVALHTLYFIWKN